MIRVDPSSVIEAQEHLTAGRLDRAEAICLALLATAPDHPLALSLLSFVRMKQQRWAEAETVLRAACALHPRNTALHATLGGLYLMLGDAGAAVAPLQTCVLLEPAVHQHRVTLVSVYQRRLFGAFDESSRRAVLACLADDALTHNLISRAWLSLLRLDPQSADVLRLFESPDYESFRAQLTPELLAAWQDNDLLNLGLRRFVVPDPVIERGLTFARRWLLAWRESDGGARLEPFLRLLCALAGYCFFTEYVFATIEDHTALGDTVSSPAEAALLGCYEPLSAHPEAKRLAALAPASPRDRTAYGDLVRIQIHEPLKEAKIKPTIAVASPIVDDVSQAVRAQYEESPYPRWSTVGKAALPAQIVAEAKGKSILVAGCGTGREAVEAAMIFPAARVDAIDLSRASLAYGVRKARELGVRNLVFLHGDILELRSSPKSFDLIVSSGVLHHLRDPLAGLRACLSALRPGGVLKVALYSTLARTEITEARAWALRAGIPPTLQGIRELRAAVMARPSDDPVRTRLTSWDDFYSTSSCRDLVFHVQEHTFTLLQIAGIVEQLGLAVLQVDTRDPAHQSAYRARFPDDPAATDLARWHALEQEHSSMFAGMYTLWLCRAAESDRVDIGWIKNTQRM